MASKVEIINYALLRLGEPTIMSIDDMSNSAVLAKNLWNMVRDSELRNHIWKFAIARAQLATDIDVPLFDFGLQYSLPYDCLRILVVGAPYPGVYFGDYIDMDPVAYRLERNKLLTNMAAPLNLRYVARVEDTTQWDAGFCVVMGLRLAITMFERVANAEDKRRGLENEYRVELVTAARANALEAAPDAIPDGTWKLGRL